ncbi:MAG TPA: methyltransferase domain-containing protein [Chitinophaga sp.]|uniref:class I SAM-dependent methyltransferase n=1 Tax=Chitinophaga sp. TaxID=1869181 RepID=UPI002DBD6119|nr:methyltransferase domain-containing protein [Chitinophaga sp.]HEU4554125.1 methyltransferase domain-containing protein [Chitinophaga sp.]
MIDSPTMNPAEVGLSTLENLSVAERLNQWMFDSIHPYVKTPILEIGSGIGNISACFVQHKIPLYVSDYTIDYCRMLQQKFAQQPLVKAVLQLDLATPGLENTCPQLVGQFNTVFALNVVEHIKDHQQAIANCYKLLAPGGRVIILVPAYQTLYNGFDRELEHYRRYTRASLRQLLESQGFHVLRTWHFNFAGIFGWFWSGTIMRRKTLPADQLKFYNKLVPLFRIADKVTMNKVGLSVIGVGEKG